MATLVNTKAKYLQYSVLNGEPSIYLESEGDKYIQELAHKQGDIDLTLEKHLQQEKEFESAHSYLPVTELSAGTSNLDDFILQTKKTENRLTNESARGETCERKDNGSNRSVSRHIQELALCVKPNSLETKLLQFAITSNKYKKDVDTRPADHPINHLHTLHESLFADLSRPDSKITAKTVTRKRKQLLESLSDPVGPKPKVTFNENKPASSLWDVNEVVTEERYRRKPVVGCALNETKKNVYTIKDGVIIPVDGKSHKNISLNREENHHNSKGKPFVSLTNASASSNISRYSIEEIRNIPRFTNYEIGSPSRVLYLKNLSKSVDEEDLVSLFQMFEKVNEAHLVYRLMQTGRMRGQAFITFNSTEDAAKALEMVNGTVCKGQPIVIQFGSNRTTK